MKLVVGLGNPGAEYEGSPHNVGFATAEKLAQRAGMTFRRSLRFRVELAKGEIAGEEVVLMKPRTYMNASGEAVGAWLRYYRVPLADIVVVHDDVDLDLGRIRIRSKGSSGGHNGLASVIQHVGSDTFVRVRLGVGRGTGNKDMITYVLSPFAVEHREVVSAMINRASEAVVEILKSGADRAMSRYNAAVGAEEKVEKE